MTRMMMLAALGLATAGSLAGSIARADDGDDNKFVLINKSTVDAIQFYTQRKDGTWSKDWLATPLKPGQSRPLHFFAGDARCEVKTRIVFSDTSEFNTPVDYCGTTNVVVTDKTLITQ
jgi:hypothetical protein